MRKYRSASGLGIVAAAAGLALAAGSPAVAAAPNAGVGLKATGIIPIAPTVVSTSPGTSPNHLASVNFAPLLSTGVIDTAADSTSAQAAVHNLSLALAPLLSLRVGTIESSCSYDPDTDAVTGDADIADGRLVVLGTPVVLQPNPAPNTTLDLASGLGTLTLNRQTVAADGTLTVDALSLNLLGLEKVDVATSVCNQADLS
ncbi:hypothetical protein ACG83_28475 [Frankia sp. R43]|uniref:choice-of-anchor P family protein n=1 Tax=Frankia sp. R43 TaxID=269536 RepID=UPI0006CA516C|nr:choice-of-anchor P family protein [Frankia sp. R43]KPM52326.1 hypothetical protein ACG83_28475 [Frankia sp. R43]